MGAEPIRVFISYASDPDRPEHLDQVRALAELLHMNGIRVSFELWEQTPLDRPVWVTAQLREVDFVIVVASPAYRRRAEGLDHTENGRDVDFDAAMLRDQLVGNRTEWSSKIVTVLLPGATEDDIPQFLNPVSRTTYEVKELTPAGLEQLLRVLTGQRMYVPPASGAVPVLAPAPLASQSPARARPGTRLPFLLVDAAFLEAQRSRPKEPFVARPPGWSDVIHGEDFDTRFIRRDQYAAILQRARADLLGQLTRGGGHRLPALFITGAPGAGKSTLARHVASQLVLEGDAVIADLGPNHGRLEPDDVQLYADALQTLAESGPPVILLMDDPFFANSGWDRLLHVLARPGHTNIAILGASPTYLFETHARQMAGSQVHVQEEVLRSTTALERQTLADMYGLDGPLDPQHGDEELLVFAIETATGESFDSIVTRIWSTLNDGKPLSRRSRVDDLEWPVRAFLIVCYLDRHHVSCPEELLRNALHAQVGDHPEDVALALRDLTIGDGWRIFRISQQGTGARATTAFGAMHPRVAERAWQVWPVRAVEPVDWIAQASVVTPTAVPQLADFLLACQSTIDPRDRQLLLKVLDRWAGTDKVSTAQLCGLVRGIRESHSAALMFRDMLRQRMRRRDAQSWLAVAELAALARPGSSERERLVSVDLEAHLKRADLSGGPRVAIELLGSRRNPAQFRTFVNTLVESLQGRLDWMLDVELLCWLLMQADADELLPLLPDVYSWIGSHPRDEAACTSLLSRLSRHPNRLTIEQLDTLLGEVEAWLVQSVDPGAILSRLFALIYAMHIAQAPMPPGVLDELRQWQRQYRDGRSAGGLLRLAHYGLGPSAEFHDVVVESLETLPHTEEHGLAKSLLWTVKLVPDQLAIRIVGEVRAWLADHVGDTHIRTTLLGLVANRDNLTDAARELTVETRAWLADHPHDTEVRKSLLGLLRNRHELEGVHAELTAETRAWLADHPHDAEVRKSLLGLVRHHRVPEGVEAELITETRAWLAEHRNDTHVRASLLGLLRNRRELDGVDVELIAETRAWLVEHPNDIQVRESLLALAASREGLSDIAGELVVETRAWLAGHPNDIQVRATLLALLAGREGLSDAAGELVVETRAWLSEHPNETHVRESLLALVAGRDGLSEAAGGLVADTRAWLADHPNDIQVRKSLLGLVRDRPELEGVDEEVINETRAWLADRAHDTQVRESLLALVGSRDGLTDVAAELVVETRAWLAEHPHDTQVRESLLALVAGHDGFGDAARQLAVETRAWLAEHPNDTHVRASLLALAGGRNGLSDAAGVLVADTRVWLADHPNDAHVRASLLALLRNRREVEGVDLELIADTRAWLAEHRNDTHVRACLLSLVGRREGLGSIAGELVVETRAWLADHRNDTHVRASLLGLVASSEGLGDTARELVVETRAWLADHRNDAHVRASLLDLAAARDGLGDLVGELVVDTQAWLAERPHDNHVRASLQALLEGRDRGCPHPTEGV